MIYILVRSSILAILASRVRRVATYHTRWSSTISTILASLSRRVVTRLLNLSSIRVTVFGITLYYTSYTNYVPARLVILSPAFFSFRPESP